MGVASNAERSLDTWADESRKEETSGGILCSMVPVASPCRCLRREMVCDDENGGRVGDVTIPVVGYDEDGNEDVGNLSKGVENLDVTAECTVRTCLLTAAA